MFEQSKDAHGTHELKGQKLPTLDDVFEDRATLSSYVKARPGRVAAAGTGVAALVGGVVTILVAADEESRVAHENLKNALQKATGTIAYANGNRIELTTPIDLIQKKAPQVFQVGGVPHSVTWLSDHEILFARQHPKGALCTVKGEDGEYTRYAGSTLIEILDIQKSQVQTLIDPYKPTERFVTQFGNCKEFDAKIAESLAKREKEFFDPPGGGIRVSVDTQLHGHFVATGFGSDPATGTRFVRVDNLWYGIVKSGEGYELENTVAVPKNSDQSKSPCGGFYLEESSGIGIATGFDWLEIRQEGNRRPSITFVKGAHSGAWRP